MVVAEKDTLDIWVNGQRVPTTVCRVSNFIVSCNSIFATLSMTMALQFCICISYILLHMVWCDIGTRVAGISFHCIATMTAASLLVHGSMSVSL